MFSEEPRWPDGRRFTDAVHAAGGHIFVQLMHTGPRRAPLNLPKGAELLAPSAIAAQARCITINKGCSLILFRGPCTEVDLAKTRERSSWHAAKNAIASGFDGVELHGANGYLLRAVHQPALQTSAPTVTVARFENSNQVRARGGESRCANAIGWRQGGHCACRPTA